jgi:large subunit ribosomal protein L29
MPSEDRIKRLSEYRTELLRLKTMIQAGGAVENPNRIKELRRAIAKIMTIEHEQKLDIRAAVPEKEKKKK